MGKYLQILSGAVLLVAAVVYWQRDSDRHAGGESDASKTVVPKKQGDTAIVYLQSDRQRPLRQPSPPATAMPPEQPPVNETDVSATDRKKRYRIVLEGVKKLENGSSREPVHLLEGRIDGSPFVMEIPRKSLQNLQVAPQLSIVEIATGRSWKTPVVFTDQLQDDSKKHIVEIETEEVDNYTYRNEKILLPGMEAD